MSLPLSKSLFTILPLVRSRQAIILAIHDGSRGPIGPTPLSFPVSMSWHGSALHHERPHSNFLSSFVSPSAFAHHPAALHGHGRKHIHSPKSTRLSWPRFARIQTSATTAYHILSLTSIKFEETQQKCPTTVTTVTMIASLCRFPHAAYPVTGINLSTRPQHRNSCAQQEMLTHSR